MPKVRVLESGYYLCTREVGEEFDVPEDFGTIPAWLEPVGEHAPKDTPHEPRPKNPQEGTKK